jgi:hypothetical protein
VVNNPQKIPLHRIKSLSARPGFQQTNNIKKYVTSASVVITNGGDLTSQNRDFLASPETAPGAGSPVPSLAPPAEGA